MTIKSVSFEQTRVVIRFSDDKVALLPIRQIYASAIPAFLLEEPMEGQRMTERPFARALTS